MRPFSRLALLLALLAASSLPVRAQQSQQVMFVRVPTRSPVVLDGLGGAGHILDRFRDVGPLELACIAFTNHDARTAKSVRVQFVFFNAGGDRSDGTLLTRNGTFSTGVRERPTNPLNNHVNREDCVPLHPPHDGFSAIIAYVDRVDFSDASTWTAGGVHIANHVEPGSPNYTYAFNDPVAVQPASASGAAVASGDLPPLFLGTFAACDQAPAVPAAHNVFVSAQPGGAVPGNLFNIGTVSVCAPSGDPAHDGAALQAVQQMGVAIREAQVFRVYFPSFSTSPGCNDAVRLLNRVLVSATPPSEMAQSPKAGEYTTVVHVTVGPDGRPLVASTSRSAGPPEFDDAARRSALASRFWPAITAGQPVAGVYDFAMRWIIEPTVRQPGNTGGQDFTRTRVFGPVEHPAGPGCAV